MVVKKKKAKKKSLTSRAKSTASRMVKSVKKAATAPVKKKKKPVRRQDWPEGTQVQSLVFDRRKYTAREARSWASEHDFKAPATDGTDNTYRLRQKSPRSFHKGTFRTITLRPGVQAVVARPKSVPLSRSKKKKK